MLTLAFFATPGSMGSSTATLGAALALDLMQQHGEQSRPVRIYSDRPHPHMRRTQLAVEPRSHYPGAEPDSSIALYDASDSIRPRTVEEAASLTRFVDGPAVWFPIVGRAPQAAQFLRRLPLRPMVPLWVERQTSEHPMPPLPPLDELCRQVLEDGVDTLGYTPTTGLRRWTQNWLDLLGPIITEAQRAEALS